MVVGQPGEPLSQAALSNAFEVSPKDQDQVSNPREHELYAELNRLCKKELANPLKKYEEIVCIPDVIYTLVIDDRITSSQNFIQVFIFHNI